MSIHKRLTDAIAGACLLLLSIAGVTPSLAADTGVVAGSKRFTESYILGEIVCRTLVAAGTPCEHRQGLGNTGILEQALAANAVQVYPEYTGTIVREILKREGNPSLDELNQRLAPRGLKAAVPLGFNNTYALGVREADAQRLGLTRVSDLTKLAPDALRLGLSHEFLTRADGWPALKTAYGLAAAPGSGLDHGLAYEALKGGQVDVIDVYSTDAKIGRYGVRVLEDDRGFFPKYDAVLLMRAALDDAPLRKLAGRIDEKTMIALNAEVELDGKTFADVAKRFVDEGGGAAAAPRGASGAASGAASAAAPGGATAATTIGTTGTTTRPTFLQRLFAPDLARLTLQHLLLVFGSLALAVAAAVPLGIWAWRRPRVAPWVLGAVGIAQTLPSLALLAFLIAAVGRIGLVPALLALFVYALLPIVRNTHAGLASVPQGLPVAGRALGLTDAQVLREVELPLALPTLLAGVKTAAVINVGTATVAAFIGAGGYGERIVSGLAVNDNATMLAGAVPAAMLALVVQAVFDVVERRLTRRANSSA